MTRIDQLIAELAPKGITFTTLGDIAELVRGNGMPKTALTDEGVGAIHYGQIYTRYGAWTDNTVSYVSPETATRLAKVNPGDIIITNTSENVEDVGKAVAWLGKKPIVTGGHATVIKHREDPKYLSYWFQSPSFVLQKKALATGTKVIDVSAKQLAKVRVPVPPVEVQREIVRILDTFQELEAELDAELEGRRRQYEHYSDHLLAFLDGDGVRRMPMDELTEGIASGNNKSRTDDGCYPVYGSTGLLGYCDRPAYSGDALLVARVGAYAGRVYAVTGNFDVSDNTLVVRPTAEWNVRFAFHQLTRMNLNQYAVGGGQPLVTGGLLKRLEIPVPPLEGQERIAAILDKFDALVNDLSIGLPAELKARRQQYEHYRDRLLTFSEAA
ncbi:MAG: restriction endonuclease subunit S [Gaiellaceae bacterium]